MASEVKTGIVIELAELGAPSLGPLDGLAGLEEDVPLATVTVSGIFPSAKEAPHIVATAEVGPAAFEGVPFIGIEAMEEFIAMGGMVEFEAMEGIEEPGASTEVSAWAQSLHMFSLGALARTGAKLLTPSVKNPLTSNSVNGRPEAFSAEANRLEAHRVWLDLYSRHKALRITG